MKQFTKAARKDRTLPIGPVIWGGFPHAPGTWARALQLHFLCGACLTYGPLLTQQCSVCSGPALGTGGHITPT